MLTDHSMPRRASPSKIQILWGLNAVAFVLVVIAGSCSYVKHHPELLDQHLAMVRSMPCSPSGTRLLLASAQFSCQCPFFVWRLA